MMAGSPLFRRYVRILVICMGGLTCTAGLIHMGVVASAQSEGVATLLDAQARAASSQIQAFLEKTIASLQWIDNLDQPGTALDLDAIRDEMHRLLPLSQAVISLSFYDSNGCERVSVSLVQPETTSPCTPSTDSTRRVTFAEARRLGISIGDVFFPDGSEPHLYIGVPSRGEGTGALVAEINLKVIHDTITAIQIGRTGLGFVVDGAGRLIAHPDETLVLRRVRVPDGFGTEISESGLRFATDFEGRRVATTSQEIQGTHWRIVVEQPTREALAPVYAALWTTGGLVVTAVLGSLIAGYIVAQRLARPLSQLRDGAARIGRGDLTTHLSVTTGDEIEQVADEFNRMAVALSDSYANLEAKVAARTTEAERRKSDAERANAAKSRFLAIASHDLRQPMHAISLLVGLLGRGPSTREQGEIIQKVQRSVDAMEELFVSLLDISKLDAGAIRPSVVDFPIEQILQRVRSSFTPLEVDPCNVLVRTDPALLERILFNLVSNGIRYTVRGHVRVLASCADRVLRLTVEDSGIGIPAQYQERIYDEFFQIDTASTQGLGLGLSIVKRCADLLGHSLTLYSDSSGSKFQLELPLIGQAIDAIPLLSGNAAKPHERLSSAFVVIIDDHADNRFAAEATYRQWGCPTLSADSASTALNSLREHLRSPDLIVTDLYLAAGTTGLEAIEAIRRNAEYSIPAIILSGEAGPPQPAALPSGCVLLQKPVGSERLKRTSERLLLQAPADSTDPTPIETSPD
jgi:signal transduction histidine kinase/CheY-like chemotaxis protein